MARRKSLEDRHVLIQTEYEYEIEAAFTYGSKSYNIMKESIQYVYIDYNYREKILPVMYMSVNLDAALYNKFMPLQSKAKMTVWIKRKKKNYTSAVYSSVIRCSCDYFMQDDPNTFIELDKNDEDLGRNYKKTFIGLIKSDLVAQNKKTFEGIYRNTNTVSLAQAATSGMRIVMQPFEHNVDLEEFYCPTITTIGQFLAYLNSKYSFYNGAFTYFMDFEKTYLISNDGSYIDAKDGDHFPYVAFDIRDLTKHQAQMVGQVNDSKQRSYIIYVNASDANISIDRSTPQLTSGTMAINELGESNTKPIDTSAITSIEANIAATTVISSTDPNAAGTQSKIVEQNSDTLTIAKVGVDARIFTLNKQYLLSNYEQNPKYCGVYYLVHKSEIYLRSGACMQCQVMLSMRKSADFK